MLRTKGQAALARALEQKTVTQADVVEAVGATQSSVSTWASGTSRPEALQREALYRCYGIPVAWWLTSEERSRLGRMRRRVALGHAARLATATGARKLNVGTGPRKDRCNRTVGRAS